MKGENMGLITTMSALKEPLGILKETCRKIVFTNGCFDLLHAGHVQYLEAARQEGDCLIVGLNSDASIRTIKDPKRPIVEEAQRAMVLSALRCVDLVVLFDEPTPIKLIKEVQPNVLVKGADWAEEEIVGAQSVKENGGKVVRIHLLPAISTTILIDRICKRYCS